MTHSKWLKMLCKKAAKKKTFIRFFFEPHLDYSSQFHDSGAKRIYFIDFSFWFLFNALMANVYYFLFSLQFAVHFA